VNEADWTKTVNGTTVLWLGIFFVGFLAFDSDLFSFAEPIIDFPQEWQLAWEIIAWGVWGVFVIDVVYKYKKSKNWKDFLENHWFDIILLIPFFRIFRLLRLLRLLKVFKITKVGLRGYKDYKKSNRVEKKSEDE